MDIWIHQNKFHQVVLKKFYIKPIQKEEQTLRTLLCYYQEIACKAYPTEAKMEIALGNLYDAKFKLSLTNSGKYSIFCYSLSAPDPAYIKDSNYTIEGLETEFLKFIEPYFPNSTANQDLFLRACEIYHSDLMGFEEDLLSKSLQQMLTTYFKDTERDFLPLGSAEELKKITPKMLYLYYQELIKEEHIAIGTGNYPSYKNLSLVSLQPKWKYTFRSRGKQKENMCIEPYSSRQAYVHILYETQIFADDSLFYACKLLNYFIGGGSSSILFKTIREKYGLCYLIHSAYYAASGILVISALIDALQIKKTISKIDKALEELQIDEIALEEAKAYFIGNTLLGDDFIDTKLHAYLTDHYFPEMPKTNKDIQGIQAVQKEDVLRAYALLKKSYTYVLGGKKNEK